MRSQCFSGACKNVIATLINAFVKINEYSSKVKIGLSLSTGSRHRMRLTPIYWFLNSVYCYDGHMDVLRSAIQC